MSHANMLHVTHVNESCHTHTHMSTGDISPYGDNCVTSKIFLCILGFGLPLYFFPDMFLFNPPPRSSVVRSATQVCVCICVYLYICVCTVYTLYIYGLV